MDRVTILYDDDCGFCRWSVSRVAFWDRARRLRFAPIRSEEGAAWLLGMDDGRQNESWHLIARDGSVASAGAAVPILLRELPGGGPLARLADALPVATGRAYRAVARRRRTLGKLLHVETCNVSVER